MANNYYKKNRKTGKRRRKIKTALKVTKSKILNLVKKLTRRNKKKTKQSGG